MRNKDGSFVVIFKNNKSDEAFLVFRPDLHLWDLPGGGIEKGETPEIAAVRETHEETGLRIKLSKRLGTYKNIDVKTGGIWNTTYLFKGEVISGEFAPEFPGCKGQWFKVNNLPKDIRPIVKIRVNDAIRAPKPFEKEFRPQVNIL